MDDDKNSELIKKITEIFYRCGIKSITMDDIAHELCISKKTLYQYFKDKNDIIEQVISFHIETLQKDLKSLYDDTQNVIDILFVISKYVSDQLIKIHPSVTFDLQKYYPEAWKKHTEFRKSLIINDIKKNIETGIRQNLFRNDFDIDIISRFYLASIENLLHNDELIKEHSFVELFNTLFIYHIRGISNKKGIDYIENKLKPKL